MGPFPSICEIERAPVGFEPDPRNNRDDSRTIDGLMGNANEIGTRALVQLKHGVLRSSTLNSILQTGCGGHYGQSVGYMT